MLRTTFQHCVYVDNEEGTLSLGAALSRLLDVGDVVSLDGPFGVGKTRFSAGIACGRGITRDDVTSPTFTLIHEYPTDPPLSHLDAYRLSDSDEFLNLGVSELWDEGIVIIEWGSKVADALPADTLWIVGRSVDDQKREWTFSAGSAWSDRWNAVSQL